VDGRRFTTTAVFSFAERKRFSATTIVMTRATFSPQPVVRLFLAPLSRAGLFFTPRRCDVALPMAAEIDARLGKFIVRVHLPGRLVDSPNAIPIPRAQKSGGRDLKLAGTCRDLV
jgi:hypothetical protein